MSFNELIKLLEANGFRLDSENHSVRYYAQKGWHNVVRVDYHGSYEVPKGTLNAILKDAGLKGKKK